MIEVTNKTNDKEFDTIIKQILEYGLKKMKVKNAFVSVVIVDNKEIHEINRVYRKVDRPTDVISFAFEDNEGVTPKGIRILGEVYLSLEKARAQASEYGHSVKREVCYLSVHGLLHLLGYDHESETDKVVMRTLEESILDGQIS